MQLLLSTEDCKVLIDKCRNHFEFVIQLVDTIKFLVKVVKSSSNNEEIKKMMKGFDEVFPAVSDSKLLTLLQQAKTNDSAKIGVCENLYNLNAPSFVEVINHFFERYAQKVDEIFGGLIEYGKSRDYKFSRSLQAEPHLENNWDLPLDGSLLLNFFSDIIVERDRKLDHPPMNLSLAFP